MLAETADEIHGTSRFELRGGEVRDALIVQVAGAALEEMETGLRGSMLLDYLAHVLVARLVRAYTGRTGGRELARTRLSARQLNTLREFVESRLDMGASVRQLAAVMGVGPQRLTAILKTSTGLTPHVYVTHLRMIRAGRLLKQRQLTLSEIALALGFAGQSHFGAVFRRYVGVTPREYRKEVFPSARHFVRRGHQFRDAAVQTSAVESAEAKE
jgi:AraC family transcriptional regulator